MNPGFKSKSEEIEWRRAKIIELKAQGLDQREIANTLQVSPTTITFDLQAMRKEAIEHVRDYSTNEVPIQLRVAEKAFRNAIQTYWKLSQEAKSDHDKIDAMEHYIDSHTNLLSLMRGLERFENDRLIENRRALAQQQRQQLIVNGGGNGQA